MAVDTDYLDDLMKSIEPIVYPDGVPDEDREENENREDTIEVNDQEPVLEPIGATKEDSDTAYEQELAQIPEKTIIDEATESEMEVAAALDAVSDEVSADDTAEESPDITETVEIVNNNTDEPAWEELSSARQEAEQEIELDMSMSEEEIDAMLNAAKSSAKEEQISPADSDISDVLDMLSDDEDVRDIKETLDKSDNNIAVDQSALEEPEIKIPDVDEDTTEDAAQDEKKGKKKKEKKVKEKKEKDGKGGFFARLFNALTEEVAEDEISVPEQAETGVTDENAKILSELDAEDDGKKKKKKKKKKKGKEDKEQPESEGTERDIREKTDDAEEGEGDGKKAKKAKKPKREKKPKEKKEEIPEKPSKKLPKKRVRNTFILCLSILAAIIILAVFLNEHLLKKEARFAFDNADYETAYSDLYGMELSEQDKEIYDKSKTIMLLQRRVSSYENYMQLGMRAEALDSLIEGVRIYPDVMEKAEQYGVTDQVREQFDKIVEGLGTFGLTKEDAQEISTYTSVVQYNMRIDSIANGTPYTYDEGNVDTQSLGSDETDIQNNTLEDILPPEEDFLPANPEDIFE
ncbi:MAG: hypothetical protein K5877_02895 [Lachnospiraceae bacterium]|nr:hypothetical protein [Lachnospiraceae bacterium]